MLWILACTECDGVATTVALTDDDGVGITEVKEAPAGYSLRAESDVSLDWSAVQSDLACVPLDPDTLVEASLWYAKQTPCADLLWQDGFTSVTGYLTSDVDGESSLSVENFTFQGTAVDFSTFFVEEPGSCWLFSLRTEERYAFFAELVPTTDQTSTTAAVVDDCIYEADADVAGATPSLPSADPECPATWTLDWSALTTSSIGEPLDPAELETLELYAYTVPLTEVDVMDLAASAAETWSMSISGTTAEMDGVDLDDGRAWVLALRDVNRGGYVPEWVTVLRSGT